MLRRLYRPGWRPAEIPDSKARPGVPCSRAATRFQACRQLISKGHVVNMMTQNRNARRSHRERCSLGGRGGARCARRRPLRLLGQDHRRVLPAVVRGARRAARKRGVPRQPARTQNAPAFGPASAASRTSRRWPNSTPPASRSCAGSSRPPRQPPTLEQLGRACRLERVSPASRVQGGHRRDAEGLCRRASRAARAQRARSQRDA